MAHDEQRDFFQRMKDKFPAAFTGVRVIEIGSLNINGTVRDFFDASTYIGVDVIGGPGVDLIQPGQDVAFTNGWFDVAVSAESFEHNQDWVETFQNMCRMSKRWVFVTCASTGRAEHGTHDQHPGDSPATHDYYKNLTESDFRAVFEMDDLFTDYGFEYNPVSCDLYFWGCVR